MESGSYLTKELPLAVRDWEELGDWWMEEEEEEEEEEEAKRASLPPWKKKALER